MGAVAWNKPLPRPTAASQPFWDGLRRHQVRLQQCEDCGQWIFYPRLHCPQCASRRLAWRDVSGEGTLYTFTVARVATLPEFSDELPQLLAVVALDEGPHLNTTLVGVEPDELRVGLRLRPVFDDRPVSFTLLRYTPAASSHPGVINAVPLQAELSAPPAPPQPLRRRIACKDLQALRGLIDGQWSGWSNEFLVSQAVIDAFALLSGDDYWIHTDPQRARADSPFGGTIAQGMLVHALISRLQLPMDFEVCDFNNMVNYGSDRLRFTAPVPSGCRIHARCRVKAAEAVKSGTQLILEIAIHVVGQERPSVLNDQIIVYM